MHTIFSKRLTLLLMGGVSPPQQSRGRAFSFRAIHFSRGQNIRADVPGMHAVHLYRGTLHFFHQALSKTTHGKLRRVINALARHGNHAEDR